MEGRVHACHHSNRSKNSFGDLVLSYHASSRDGTQVIGLGRKHLQQLITHYSISDSQEVLF